MGCLAALNRLEVHAKQSQHEDTEGAYVGSIFVIIMVHLQFPKYYRLRLRLAYNYYCGGFSSIMLYLLALVEIILKPRLTKMRSDPVTTFAKRSQPVHLVAESHRAQVLLVGHLRGDGR